MDHGPCLSYDAHGGWCSYTRAEAFSHHIVFAGSVLLLAFKERTHSNEEA